MQVEYTIDYRGPWLSWNTLLSLNRWQRQKLVGEAKQRYQELLAGAGVLPLASFVVEVRYWSRLDCDNICLKYLVDTMRAQGLVTNDDKRYFAGVTSIPDAALGHNQYRIIIRGTPAVGNPQTLAKKRVKVKEIKPGLRKLR